MAQIKQIERLIRIMQRLTFKRTVTIGELYHYFEGGVPKRTLQRDMLELSNAGIPLIDDKGKGKELVWSIEQGYLKFIPIKFQPREIASGFFLKSFSSLFKGTPLQQEAENFFKKAKQLYPTDIVADSNMNQFDNIFGFSWTGYIDYAPYSTIINSLLEAIAEHIVVVINYRPHWKKAETPIECHPYMILFHKGALYAVVRTSNYDKYYFLPIQRIRGIEITDKRFKRDAGFSLEKLRKGRFGIFGHEGLKPQKVVLKFSPDVAEVVAERIWHPSQKIKRHRDGTLTLEMKVVISDELRSWVAGWLGYVEVMKPKLLME